MPLDVGKILGDPPSNVFEAIQNMNKSHATIFSLVSVLESVLINSDIDEDWKSHIKKKLIEIGWTE